MRSTLRLLATAARTLEPYAPTGIAGLPTHPQPRSALLYLYSTTLEKLKSFPESSAYRKSTEALTKQRLAVVDAVKPSDYDAWLKRVGDLHKKDEMLQKLLGKNADLAAKSYFIYLHFRTENDARLDEGRYYDDRPGEAQPEGSRTEQEKAHQGDFFKDSGPVRVEWEPEPPLTVEQIGDIEQKIGAGLIEEVIQVAEGELKLVETLQEAKPWEDLIEKPLPGQWKYFER